MEGQAAKVQQQPFVVRMENRGVFSKYRLFI